MKTLSFFKKLAFVWLFLHVQFMVCSVAESLINWHKIYQLRIYKVLSLRYELWSSTLCEDGKYLTWKKQQHLTFIETQSWDILFNSHCSWPYIKIFFPHSNQFLSAYGILVNINLYQCTTTLLYQAVNGKKAGILFFYLCISSYNAWPL